MAMTVVVEVEVPEIVPGSCGLQLVLKPQAVGFEKFETRCDKK